MSAQFTPRTAGDRAVKILDISGRIEFRDGTSALFREAIRDLLLKGWKNIILNLAEVSYVDSSGVVELVSAFTTVANRSGRLKLLNPTKRVSDLLQVTKLYNVFEIYDDEVTAIASFAPANAAESDSHMSFPRHGADGKLMDPC